jgi:PAS domain S-box-containing protein
MGRPTGTTAEFAETSSDDQRRFAEISNSEAQVKQVPSDIFEAVQNRLRSGEAHFRSIYEHAHMGIGISDFDGWFVGCNPAFARIVGYEEAELTGTLFADLVHPEDMEANTALFGPLLAREVDSFETVSRYIHKSGAPVWVHKYISLIFDAANEPTSILVLATDMTEIKRNELALAESEARFRMLADTIPALVFVADENGENIYSNPQFSAYTGFDQEMLFGDGWLNVIHPDDRQRGKETWEASWRDQQPYEAEYRFRAHSGDYRTFLVRSNPVRSGSGQIVQWVGTCTDIEDAVQLRDALAKSRIELQSVNVDLEAQVAARTSELTRANRSLQAEIKRNEAAQAALVQSQKLEALGQLTSGIAHDFNNILAAVAGGLALIETRVDDEFVKGLAKHCKDAAFRGAKLIKQMLAFARQEVLTPFPVDLAWLAGEVEPLITQTIPGNIVSLNFPADLPKVQIDPVLLETALLNLAVNARDAMPGGGELSISAKLSLAEERGRPLELAGKSAVAITVRDNGHGMPPEVIQRVTEPFFTTKERGKGTGLGLAMVHGFIVQSGGAMRIESRPGKGTSITLYLPCATEQGDAPTQTPVNSDSIVRGDAAILLVDDDADVRAITAAQLQDLGYSVTEAGSLSQALAVFDVGSHFDCIVSDVVMPGGDGIALAAAIRTRRRDVPFLFLTGQAEGDRVAGELTVQKPFTMSGLSQAVAGLVDRASDERATLAKIESRSRSNSIKDMLDLWIQARAIGKTPLLTTFDPNHCTAPRNLVVMKADPAHLPMRFEFVSAGDELESLLGRPLTGTELDVRGADGLGSIEDSYRRCVKTRLPVYDYTRMNLGEGEAEMFERLILPYSSDGRLVDRLVAIVVFGRIPAN